MELCVQAGHPEPQFEEAAGSVTVSFFVAGYLPPLRVEHDLTDRQRRILHLLSDGKKWKASEIAAALPTPTPATTLRDDLMMLRKLGLIETSGRGPGSRWFLKGH